MKLTDLPQLVDLKRMQFKIGELSKMTDVSTRQLRYWEKKEFIHSLQREDDNDARVFGFKAYIKVRLIKTYLDEGYTLGAANDKSKSTIMDAKWFHDFVNGAVKGITDIDGKRAVNLGYLDEEHTQILYGFNDERGVHYQVHDVDEKE